MTTQTFTYTQPLPYWLESAYARQTPCGDWIVTLYARTNGIGHGFAKANARIRIQRDFDKPEHAIHWAQGTPTAKKIRVTAEGCHIMSKLKAKYDKETRREIFGPLAAQLRAKYDGINYLYESEEAQSELRSALKINSTFAENYPVGLVQP